MSPQCAKATAGTPVNLLGSPRMERTISPLIPVCKMVPRFTAKLAEWTPNMCSRGALGRTWLQLPGAALRTTSPPKHSQPQNRFFTGRLASNPYLFALRHSGTLLARAGATWRETVPPIPPLPSASSYGLSPCSEIEAQAQLDLTRIVRLGGKHAKCLRALQAHRRVQEIHMIKQVEQFRREGKRGFLRQLDFLHETYVHAPGPQTSQRAASRGGVRAELDGPKQGANSPRIGEDV